MRFRAFSRSLVAAVLLSAAASAAHAQTFTIEPRDPSSLEPVRITLSLYSFLDPHLQLEGVHGNQIVFLGDPPPLEGTLPPLYVLSADVGPLPAGIYQAVFMFRGETSTVTHSFRVRAPEPGLVFPDQKDGWSTEVDVDWKIPSGQTGHGVGVALTDQSGYFWFFSPGNAEVTVKVLDGRGVNGHWWVFLASMTNVEFTASVSRCPPPGVGAPCVTKQYHQQQGKNRNFLDTGAFN
ncbi:MAG TPA: hypothetical protein VEW48_19555 [Thermoanaerobaculia bacterium]|nr:hypothetical protein [Thermoanaerobaculia bacterium]